MPLVYTKEEIKAYLANRGFDVSNEEIINKFIHGKLLKLLIIIIIAFGFINLFGSNYHF
jgi:hypothetical protein